MHSFTSFDLLFSDVKIQQFGRLPPSLHGIPGCLGRHIRPENQRKYVFERCYEDSLIEYTRKFTGTSVAAMFNFS
jgi:hypothetical protein